MKGAQETWVICKDNSKPPVGGILLTHGKFYKVIGERPGTIEVVNDRGRIGSYNSWRFRAASVEDHLLAEGPGPIPPSTDHQAIYLAQAIF